MKTYKQIREELNQSVLGQPELVDKVSMTVYRHILKSKSNDPYIHSAVNNLLIIGNTGTGKTFSVREAARVLELPLIEINAKSISQEGWHGVSFIEHLTKGLNQVYKTNTEEYQLPIIFIDEIDKLCTSNISSGGDNTSYHLQSGLLKYIEGCNVNRNGYSFNTSEFCFILAGAFTGMFEKESLKIGFEAYKETSDNEVADQLIKFGMLPELVGRLVRQTVTNNISADLFRDLLCSPDFISNRWYKFLKEQGIDRLTEPNYSYIIDQAVRKNLGVRGLIQLLDVEIDRLILEHNIKHGL